MTRARLKAVSCPSCRGTGKSPCRNWTCAWCVGLRRVPVATALRWASQCEMLAYGGYLNGDYNAADMRRMQADAMVVRALIASFGWSAS